MADLDGSENIRRASRILSSSLSPSPPRPIIRLSRGYSFAGVGIFDVLGASAEGAFITTKPDACKCRTSRSAVIRAIVSSAWWTRFRPSYRSAKDKVSAISSGVAGRRRGMLGMARR